MNSTDSLCNKDFPFQTQKLAIQQKYFVLDQGNGLLDWILFNTMYPYM